MLACELRMSVLSMWLFGVHGRLGFRFFYLLPGFLKLIFWSSLLACCSSAREANSPDRVQSNGRPSRLTKGMTQETLLGRIDSVFWSEATRPASDPKTPIAIEVALARHKTKTQIRDSRCGPLFCRLEAVHEGLGEMRAFSRFLSMNVPWRMQPTTFFYDRATFRTIVFVAQSGHFLPTM